MLLCPSGDEPGVMIGTAELAHLAAAGWRGVRRPLPRVGMGMSMATAMLTRRFAPQEHAPGRLRNGASGRTIGAMEFVIQCKFAGGEDMHE